ncbi:B-cell differentiation antigen CD72 [Sorex araneus]|uniref:B-cell differentiation antigen CD72 n=1 Tax=Sorex araneus TaxID=42254 RepID=UPI00243397F9|nr:B-cell differentiation antigen CD72 [Sorex araneus]
MAESITYADLRFVKAPLKNAVCQLDQDVDEDGDLTYENVQVCPAPGALASLASSGPGDKAGPCTGLGSEQQPSSWPSATPLATGRVLCGRAICTKYVLLGLLLGCLLLGVAAIGLGVRYLQVSQQLQRAHRNLESTNSSLGQRLHQAEAKLKQQAEELQGARLELTQREESLHKVQQVGQDTQRQLDNCRREQDETKNTLRSEQEQRSNLEQRLKSMESMRDKLRQFFTCNSPDFCCPVGWTLKRGTCFHISPTRKTWQESQEYCNSLSSDMIATESYSLDKIKNAFYSLFDELPWSGPYWIHYRPPDEREHWDDPEKKCATVIQSTWNHKPLYLKLWSNCMNPLHCICELKAFRYPDVEYSLH